MTGAPPFYPPYLGLQYSELIEKAKAGDRNAGLFSLWHLWRDLKSGRELSPTKRAYLSDALAEIVKGADANDALHVSKTRGRPADYAKEERDIRIAMDVYGLVNFYALSVEDAIAKGAEDNSVSERTAMRAWSKYKDWINRDEDDAVPETT